MMDIIQWVLWAENPLGLQLREFLAHKIHLIGNCANFQWPWVRAIMCMDIVTVLTYTQCMVTPYFFMLHHTSTYR